MATLCWFRRPQTTSIDWDRFGDIDNELIADACKAKQNSVVLDEYTIDFNKKIGVANDGCIHDVECRMVDTVKRDEFGYKQRFTASEQTRIRSFDTFSHESRSLIWKWISQHNILTELQPEIRPEKYAWVLENAAKGILYEGLQLDKGKEAEFLANKLLEVRQSSIDEIHIRVVQIYTRQSFLYKLLNEQLRLHETSKTDTLGPYAFLLWLSWHIPTFRCYAYRQRVYRSTNLNDDMINEYQRAIGKGPCTWLGFTSTSKRREIAVSNSC